MSVSEQRKRTARSLNRFNRRELTRAVRAVADAGADVDAVEVDPATGKFCVILAKPGVGTAENAATRAWNKATEAISKKGAPTRR
jgi:hypothetical protein